MSEYTAEQIAAAQALLASLTPKKPRVWWAVRDGDGELRPVAGRMLSDRVDAERLRSDLSKIGGDPPYVLVRIEEVL